MMGTQDDAAWAKLLAKVDAKSADYAKQNAAYRAKHHRDPATASYGADFKTADNAEHALGSFEYFGRR